MFNAEFGGQVSWLHPAALILARRGLVLHRWRAPRTDRHARRARCSGAVAARHRAGLQLRPGHHPPVLHGGPGPGDRRAGRHRRRRRCGARRDRPWPPHACSPSPSRSPRVVVRRCCDRTADWHPVAARRRARRRLARRRPAPSSPARLRGRGRAGRRPPSRRRRGRLAGPAAYSLATAATAAHRRHPDAPGPAVGGGGFGGARRPRRRLRRRRPADRRRRRPAARPDRRAGTGGAAGLGGGRRGGGPAACSTAARPAAAVTALLDADAGSLHLGRGHRRLQQRRRLPARHRRAGHGDRRLQRHRPHARRSPSSSVVADGKIHYFIAGGGRRRRRPGRRRPREHVEPDHDVGRAATSPPRPSAARPSTT